jgi:hypothetical protein
MVDERPIDADVATRRTVAGCHGNLGRKVTLAACGDSAREEFHERHHLSGRVDRHRHGDPLLRRPALAEPGIGLRHEQAEVRFSVRNFSVK